MNRDVAIAIGVADAERLPYLAGAVNGARVFHDWASKVGYDSKLITDENDQEQVTIPRLRSELESMLTSGGGPIHRMVLYFAGHGLIREAEEGLWLLSDWYSEQRAVAIEVLKRRLYDHSIQQIAIFADCCRSLPQDIRAADLTADGVLGRGPVPYVKTPAIDKFIATLDGTTAFMVPGATPNQDRCLFSGVLMEGLWGKSEALSKLLKDKVTSRSLGAYLQDEAPKRAKLYKRKLSPQVLPSFPEDDDIYFYSGPGTPPRPPTFSEWPPPSVVIGVETREIDAVRSRKAQKTASSERLIETIRNQPRPDHFETGAGFAVDGGSVTGIWTPADLLAEKLSQTNWWRLEHKSNFELRKSEPVLIEFDDGVFAAVAAIPHFIATIIRNERGVSALIYRRVYEPVDTAADAERVIAEMERGALRADDAINIAVKLRQAKHSDPVLGVISAYLYDSLGDIDSIRRMAYYYVSYGQPIPYDIALLAQLRGELRDDGILRAHVPAVNKREARTEAEQEYEWTHSGTPAVDGEVGGLWPWMRQGWPFLDEPSDDESTLVTRGLVEVGRHLTPGRFTTVDRVGAVELARIFDLARPVELDLVSA